MAEASIENFDDLLHAARAQRQPQRLLFVFAGVELPDGSTPEQQARFAAGEGGALVPLMCVDKSPEEVTSFAALAEESRAMGQDWTIVFVAALSGSGGQAPAATDVDGQLQRMVEAIKAGSFGSYLPFDHSGAPVRFG